MTRSPRVADHNLCLLPTDTTGRHRSARYDSARPCSALDVSRHNLNWMHCGTESQWRWSSRTCLMWACFLAPTSNRAAVFSTDCRRSSWYRGAPFQQTSQYSGDDEAVEYCFCNFRRSAAGGSIGWLAGPEQRGGRTLSMIAGWRTQRMTRGPCSAAGADADESYTA